MTKFSCWRMDQEDYFHRSLFICEAFLSQENSITCSNEMILRYHKFNMSKTLSVRKTILLRFVAGSTTIYLVFITRNLGVIPPLHSLYSESCGFQLRICVPYTTASAFHLFSMPNFYFIPFSMLRGPTFLK